MRCLVTGGAGFIGGHLADRLVADGHEVTVVDNLATGFRENVPARARFVDMDIADRALDQVFAESLPEIVWHHAAQANVRKSVEDPAYDARQNVLGSIHLIECVRRHAVARLVYASTGGGVYGEPDALPVTEDHPIRPLCPYGVSKYTVEKYVELYGRLHGLQYVILRYANVYGPRQNPKGEAGVVAIFSRLLLQGERPHIFGDGTKTRDYVFIEDVVRANILAMAHGTGRIYNIGTGRRVSDLEVYAAVHAAVGADVPAVHEDFKTGEVMHICLDAGRARRELGWEPRVDLNEGIRRAVAFYREQVRAT